MISRARLVKSVLRTNYYQKYGIPRNATDQEIKAAINRYTLENSIRQGLSIGPKNFRGKMVVGMAARDQWAKFILLQHRESYNIYVDEGNLGKAMANSFVKPKIIKLEAKPSQKHSDSGSKSSSDHPSAEELNAKMAKRQKESWKGNTAKENTNNTAKSDPKPESDKKSEEPEKEEEPFIATEIQDKNKSKLSASDIGFLTGPFIILASRTPAGRRAIGIILGIPGKAMAIFETKK